MKIQRDGFTVPLTRSGVVQRPSICGSTAHGTQPQTHTRSDAREESEARARETSPHTPSRRRAHEEQLRRGGARGSVSAAPRARRARAPRPLRGSASALPLVVALGVLRYCAQPVPTVLVVPVARRPPLLEREARPGERHREARVDPRLPALVCEERGSGTSPEVVRRSQRCSSVERVHTSENGAPLKAPQHATKNAEVCECQGWCSRMLCICIQKFGSPFPTHNKDATLPLTLSS